jgi:hypothetical protein
MSQLQLALLIAGAVLIVGVVAYNRWLLWQVNRKADTASNYEIDSLLSLNRSTTIRGERTEPRISTVAGDNTTITSVMADRGFDEDVEDVVSVSFDEPLIGQVLLDACAGFERAGAKPVKIAATHAVSHKLEMIRPDEFYSGLHMAVLLANRSGALNAIEYSEFIQEVLRVAEKLEVSIETPDMKEVLLRAQALDAELAKLDMQLAIHIVTNGAVWSVEMVTRAAVEAGFAIRPNGWFVYFRSGAEIFQMYAVDTEGRQIAALPGIKNQVEALSIIFDVPRAPEIEMPFQTLIAVARNMATRLGASVVDDHRNPVTDAAIIQVQDQLKPLYSKLRGMEVQAGSPRALRLFA